MYLTFELHLSRTTQSKVFVLDHTTDAENTPWPLDHTFCDQAYMEMTPVYVATIFRGFVSKESDDGNLPHPTQLSLGKFLTEMQIIS